MAAIMTLNMDQPLVQDFHPNKLSKQVAADDDDAASTCAPSTCGNTILAFDNTYVDETSEEEDSILSIPKMVIGKIAVVVYAVLSVPAIIFTEGQIYPGSDAGTFDY